MAETNSICKIKLFLLGNSGVGKTCLVQKYVNNIFQADHISTIGMESFSKETILPNGEKVLIDFIDTAGQERYKSISYNLVRNAEGIILMYDITNIKTFESIIEWVDSIRKIKPNDFPILLVGNKCDLEEERLIETEEGRQEAEKYGFLFLETSIKNGINVDEAVSTLALKVYEQKSKEEKENKNKNKKDNIHLKNVQIERRRGCNC
jgi:small GTP-binding protein